MRVTGESRRPLIPGRIICGTRLANPGVLTCMLRQFAALSATLGILAGQPAVPTWKEFSIGPARAGRIVRASNIRQGILQTNSISLKSLIGMATGVAPERITAPAWLDNEHYAVTATLSDESRLRLRTRSPEDPRVIEEFRSLLTQELAQRFRLEFHKEERENRESTLRAAEGRSLTLHPSTARETGRVTINNSALSANTTLDARNVTFRAIGQWLQSYLEEPVTTDSSLPTGTYDFHLKWKTGDHSSLLMSLKDQLGLELVRESHRVPHLVVDRVERPESRLAPAPDLSRAPAPAAAPDSQHKFTPTELRRDLRVMREALEEGHPGIYRFTPKAEMDRVFDRAAAQLSRPMTALEFYRVLAPAVAAMKCGHTSLMPSRGIQQRIEGEPLMPIEAAVLGGKVYIARDFSEGGLLNGAELLSINEVPIQRILASMLAVVHGDGDSSTAGPYQLSHRRGFARNLYLIAGMQSPFRVRYRMGGGISETSLTGIPMKAMRDAELRRYPSASQAASATSRLLEGDSIGLLKITAFDGNAEGDVPLSDFFKGFFTELRDKHVSKLILDVRDNGGGE